MSLIRLVRGGRRNHYDLHEEIKYSWNCSLHLIEASIINQIIKQFMINLLVAVQWKFRARIQMGGGGGGSGSGPSLEKHRNIGFLSNTGLDPLKNYTATKGAINGMPAKRPFHWRTNDGPQIVVF